MVFELNNSYLGDHFIYLTHRSVFKDLINISIDIILHIFIFKQMIWIDDPRNRKRIMVIILGVKQFAREALH